MKWFKKDYLKFRFYERGVIERDGVKFFWYSSYDVNLECYFVNVSLDNENGCEWGTRVACLSDTACENSLTMHKNFALVAEGAVNDLLDVLKVGRERKNI